MKTPRSRKGTRDRILDAAEAIVDEVGVANLTLEQVAKRADVSKGGILYHFPSKEALTEAMVARFTQRFDDAVGELAREEEAAQGASKGRMTRAYLRATLGQAASTGPRFDRACGSITAALANYPEHLAQVRDQSLRWQRAVEADGLDPVFATIIRLAIDGLWLGENFNLFRIDRSMRARLAARLVAWTRLAALPTADGQGQPIAEATPLPQPRKKRAAR
jgi:AcrR family transcriptional regulator